MMKRYFMLMALSPLLAGCLAMPLSTPLQGGTLCLTPDFGGGFTTKAAISKYAQADIFHLQLDLYNGATLVATKDILNANLGTTVTINNLKSDTAYTIKASAYKANTVLAADLISIPATSQATVSVLSDNSPTLAGIPVKLIDTPFGATSTGSVLVTPSVNFTTPATESFL
jgi:hypothetical protein